MVWFVLCSTILADSRHGNVPQNTLVTHSFWCCHFISHSMKECFQSFSHTHYFSCYCCVSGIKEEKLKEYLSQKLSQIQQGKCYYFYLLHLHFSHLCKFFSHFPLWCLPFLYLFYSGANVCGLKIHFYFIILIVIPFSIFLSFTLSSFFTSFQLRLKHFSSHTYS